MRVIRRRSKAQVADWSAVRLSILDCLNHRVFLTETVVGSKHLDRHDLHILIIRDSRNSVFSTASRDRSCTVSPVIVLFSYIDLIRVDEKIPAVHVIHISISIVVDSVSRNLPLVRPDRILQIRMIDIDSRVNHSDCDISSLRRRVLIVQLPRRQNVDVDSLYWGDRRLIIGIRTGNRCRNSEIVCKINPLCKLWIAVLKLILDLHILKFPVILESPLIASIGIGRGQILLSRTIDPGGKRHLCLCLLLRIFHLRIFHFRLLRIDGKRKISCQKYRQKRCNHSLIILSRHIWSSPFRANVLSESFYACFCEKSAVKAGARETPGVHAMHGRYLPFQTETYSV